MVSMTASESASGIRAQSGRRKSRSLVAFVCGRSPIARPYRRPAVALCSGT